MNYSDALKVIFKWFIPLVAMAVIFWFIYRLITIGFLFLTCILPLYRLRDTMIKNGSPIPPASFAWKIIGTACVFPFLLALIVGINMEVTEDIYMANNIVNSILVMVLPAFFVSCVLFLSSKNWERTKAKYGTA